MLNFYRSEFALNVYCFKSKQYVISRKRICLFLRTFHSSTYHSQHFCHSRKQRRNVFYNAQLARGMMAWNYGGPFPPIPRLKTDHFKSHLRLEKQPEDTQSHVTENSDAEEVPDGFCLPKKTQYQIWRICGCFIRDEATMSKSKRLLLCPY